MGGGEGGGGEGVGWGGGGGWLRPRCRVSHLILVYSLGKACYLCSR